MAKPTRRQIPDLKDSYRPLKAEDLQVQATPTAAIENFGTDHEAEQLVRSLAGFSDVLGRLQDHRTAEQFQQNRQDQTAGAAYAQAGGTDMAGRSNGFMTGFQIGAGEAAAIADFKELTQKYETDLPDITDPSIDGYIANFYDQKMRGQDNGAYQQGYDNVFAQSAQALRNEHGERIAQRIVETQRANALNRLDELVRKHEAAGEFGDQFLGDANEILTQHSVPNKDRNNLIFLAIHSRAETKPELYDALKIPRKDADGRDLPPIYSIPEFRSKIDAAQGQAMRAANAEDDRQARTMKAAREAAQQHSLIAVMERLDQGDDIGAQRALEFMLSRRDLFPTAKEIHEARQMIAQYQKLGDAPENIVEEHQVLDGIHAGTITTRTAITRNASLTPAQKMRLLSQLSSREAAARQADNEGRAEKRAADAETRSLTSNPVFKDERQRLRDTLTSVEKDLGDVTERARSMRRVIATELQGQLTAWRLANPAAGDTELREQTDVLIQAGERTFARRYRAETGQSSTNDRIIELANRYRYDLVSLRRAAERGDISPIEFDRLMQLYRAARADQKQPGSDKQ